MIPSLRQSPSLRSGDLSRIRPVLRAPPTDPLLDRCTRSASRATGTSSSKSSAALTAFGARAAGQLVDALLDPATPDVVRRRLPLVLKSCAFEPRTRWPRPGARRLQLRGSAALRAGAPGADRQTSRAGAPAAGHPRGCRARARAARATTAPCREHVFNLLALVLEREPVQHRGAGVRLRRHLPARHRARVSRDGPSAGHLRSAGSATLAVAPRRFSITGMPRRPARDLLQAAATIHFTRRRVAATALRARSRDGRLDR